MKSIRKHRLQNVDHFVQASMCSTIQWVELADSILNQREIELIDGCEYGYAGSSRGDSQLAHGFEGKQGISTGCSHMIHLQSIARTKNLLILTNVVLKLLILAYCRHMAI